MPERTVAVGSATGLHARPAKLFVEAVTQQPVQVTIRVGDRPAVSARSLLAVLTLDVRQGTEVTLAAEGDQAEATLDTLAAMLARDLDAD